MSKIENGNKAVLCMVAAMAGGFANAAWAVDLAKINGRTITDKDVKTALSGFNEGQRDAIMKDPQSRKQVLANLMDQEILSQQAEKEKLDQDAEYKTALASFRKQYLANRLIQKEVVAKSTEAEAKKYFDQHKSEYTTDQIHVFHILVDTEGKANELLKQLKNPSVDFQQVAERESKDPSAKNNRGDLGSVTRDSPFVPEFKDAAFGAKIGEVVGPVKTSFGYHLIKVTDKKLGKAMNYDEVELRVKNELRERKMSEYVTGLKRKAKITVDEKALGKL